MTASSHGDADAEVLLAAMTMQQSLHQGHQGHVEGRRTAAAEMLQPQHEAWFQFDIGGSAAN